jgi:putative glutamine amidotransferase
MHKEKANESLDVQYAPAHEVEFTAGGLLSRITGERRAQVNSLHSQGIDRLGKGLDVEATAEDGLVEAFSVAGSPGFTLAVQWHPEWKILSNPVSMAIYTAFGDACRAYRLRELTPSQAARARG